MHPGEGRILWWRAARVAFGLAVFWVAFRDVTPAALRQALRDIDWRWLTAAGLSTLGTLVALTFRWRLLISRTLERGGNRILFAAIVVGQTANIVVPFKLGDAARVGAVSRCLRIPAGEVLGSVALERLFDTLGVAITAAVLVALGQLPPFARSGMISLLWTLAAVFAVLMVLRVALRRGSIDLPGVRWLPTRLTSHLMRLLASLGRAASVKVLLLTVTASALVMATSILTCALVLHAFGFPLPLVAAAVLVIVLQIGNAVVPVPGAIGIAQVLTVQTLALWHVPEPDALAFALVLYLVARLPKILLLPLALPVLAADRQDA